MGGIGSGGHNRIHNGAIEQTPCLRVNDLRKRGGLRIGAHTSWRWSRGQETIASIGVQMCGGHIELRYAVQCAWGEARAIRQPVTILRQACRFGGVRALFLCPRCRRSVLVLALAGAHFMCRHCAGLTYASRREHERDRHLRRANRLRRRLGGPEGAFNGPPRRPRGMWRRTYERMLDEIEHREDVAMRELAAWMLARGRV